MANLRVLVVDDSIVFRNRIQAVIDEVDGLQVTGTAQNGRIAMSKLQAEAFDLVTLDLEMPEMDGMATLKAIREAGINVKVIVFSAVSPVGMDATFLALNAGAVDFVTKPGGDTTSFQQAMEQVKSQLLPKLLQFVPREQARSLGETRTVATNAPVAAPKQSWPQVKLDSLFPDAIVIASSTGGPAALSQLFEGFNVKATVPIFIAQHMPAGFTKTLASRIGKIAGMDCHEPVDGETALPGCIYIAPGDWHMYLYQERGLIKIRIDQADKRNLVRPAADHLFETAATCYGAGLCGMVLTGMGSDGCHGAIAIKDKGGAVIIQDAASSVVWGMPGAVHEAGAFDSMQTLADCRRQLSQLASRKRSSTVHLKEKSA